MCCVYSRMALFMSVHQRGGDGLSKEGGFTVRRFSAKFF